MFGSKDLFSLLWSKWVGRSVIPLMAWSSNVVLTLIFQLFKWQQKEGYNIGGGGLARLEKVVLERDLEKHILRIPDARKISRIVAGQGINVDQSQIKGEYRLEFTRDRFLFNDGTTGSPEEEQEDSTSTRTTTDHDVNNDNINHIANNETRKLKLSWKLMPVDVPSDMERELQAKGKEWGAEVEIDPRNGDILKIQLPSAFCGHKRGLGSCGFINKSAKL